MSFVLAKKILDLLKDSGANHQEALCALDGAKAFLPDLDLSPKPSFVIRGAPVVDPRCE